MKRIFRYLFTTFTLGLLILIGYNISIHTKESTDVSAALEESAVFFSPTPSPIPEDELESAAKITQ